MRNLFFFILIAISSLSIAQGTNEKIIQNDYLLAENYYRENSFEKATLLYKKLYDSSPFNSNYLERLISCYQETDRFLIAEQLLKNKIKTNKDHGYLYVYLGYNYEKQQLKDTAQINYKIFPKVQYCL